MTNAFHTLILNFRELKLIIHKDGKERDISSFITKVDHYLNSEKTKK